jgi:SAM-dependent methyltransferase
LSTSSHRGRDLFLVTFGILALELAVIRWMSQQVRLFAYLNNVLLISAFLGMGLGVGVGKRRPGLFQWALPALAVLCAVLAFAEKLGIVHLSMPDDAIAMWGLVKAPQFVRSLGIVSVLFGAVTLVFLCAGTRVGALFAESDSLDAYSADLAGSLAGVIAVSILSWLETPPLFWFAAGAIPIAFLARSWKSWAALAAVLVLTFISRGDAIFSPYYRIDIDQATHVTGNPVRLSVNRDFHQYINDLSFKRLSDPSVPEDVRMRLRGAEQMYRLPFLLSPEKKRALVVGAGTGNDVAAALRAGFGEVVAVEIDPRIWKVGKARHPERPYDDPRVRPVINDARAYFEQNPDERFNVVTFGLLDSHAMFSAMSTLRLDNYVYTAESVRSAWNRLDSPGILCISFSTGRLQWISDRLFAVVRDATGIEPVIVEHGLQRGRFYLVGKGVDVRALLARYRIPESPPTALAETIRVPSDDWPFLYLKPGVVPYGYLAVLTLILLTAVIGVRFAFGEGILHRSRFDPVLFLMGAAFLLLETRGVTSMSLLFGSTWVVNSAVFAGILGLAWLGNALVRRKRTIDVQLTFALLFLALMLNYFIGPEDLLQFPMLVRGMIGGLVVGLPVGLAGITFSTLLARSAHPDASLGSNLLGAVVGGCVEYLSILTGLRALVLLALVFYMGAFLWVRRGVRS